MNLPLDAAAAALFERVNTSFLRQGMMQHLGTRLLRVAPGEVELALPYSERVVQQQGGFHGGAMGALADIAGGYAALTVAPEGMEVTTVEYKINFLAGFPGRRAARHRQGAARRQAHHRHHGRGGARGGRRQAFGLRGDAADAGAGAQDILNTCGTDPDLRSRFALSPTE